MALEVYEFYNRFTSYKNYYEVGRSAAAGYHWITLTGTLSKPADQLTLKIPYEVLTYSNTYGVVVNQSISHPGSGNNGKISSSIINGKFSSGEGRFDSSTGNQGWNSYTATVILNGKFNAGVNYVHIGLLAGTTINYGVLDISDTGCTLTVSKDRTYTITYNANNGTNAPSVGYKTYSKPYTITSDKPTRKGYVFVNWNTKQDGSGTTYLPGNSYTSDANVTLYAQWKENTLTFKMNVNGGKKASDAPTSMSIVNGFALDNGTHQVITYTNRNNTIYLRQYNNKSQIKLTYPGHIITKGKEFCSTTDGSGTLYDQSKGYSLADFIGENGLDNGSKEITLYVNWKTGGIVHYSDGSQWIPCQVYYSDGTQWVHVMPYYSDGNEWTQCT